MIYSKKNRSQRQQLISIPYDVKYFTKTMFMCVFGETEEERREIFSSTNTESYWKFQSLQCGTLF